MLNLAMLKIFSEKLLKLIRLSYRKLKLIVLISKAISYIKIKILFMLFYFGKTNYDGI